MSQRLFGKQVSNGTDLFSEIASLTVGPSFGERAWQSVQIHSQMCDSTQQNRKMSNVQENSSGDIGAILEGGDFIMVRKYTQEGDNVIQVEQFSIKELAL